MNFRKHLKAAPGVDPRSSAPWFDGWRSRSPTPSGAAPVEPPRTWLAAAGWRRAGGPLAFDERPRAGLAPRAQRVATLADPALRST